MEKCKSLGSIGLLTSRNRRVTAVMIGSPNLILAIVGLYSLALHWEPLTLQKQRLQPSLRLGRQLHLKRARPIGLARWVSQKLVLNPRIPPNSDSRILLLLLLMSQI